MQLGNIAEWVSAGAAILAAYLVISQLRQNTAISSINAARIFLEETEAQWALCRASADPHNFDIHNFRSELYKLIAKLELNVAAYMETGYPRRIENMIQNTIISYMNEMIESNYDPYILEIFSNEIMCPCLKDFCLQRQNLFDQRPRLLAALSIPKHALS